MSVVQRRQKIERAHVHLSIAAQRRLVSISRSSFYYAPEPEPETAGTLALMAVIDAAFLERIEQPALFIGGGRDPTTTLFGAVTDPVAVMRPHVPLVEGHVLDGCGHWTQQERPEDVNRLLLDWLARLPV